MHHLNAARWAELNPLLDELLTLPRSEQARRLDALAANDHATAGQLRALLDARDAASHADFLGGVAHAPLAGQTEAAGELLGSWTLVDLIGQGGMGSVWRARRSDGRFDGEAAIKLMRSGLFDAGAQERFRREGAFLAKLRHPGIAQLLDAGITERGQPFLVLELVDGIPVDLWCDGQRSNVSKRLALFGAVLSAVAHAHSHLVIHRDLKPSNILVTPDGRAKLLDFGIAKLVDDGQDEPEVGRLTREGGQALTPEYAAPEQLLGQAVTTATDVYALGVLLHLLLAGRHPMAVERTRPGELARATLEDDPERMSAIARQHDAVACSDWATNRSSTPQRLARELGGDLQSIVSKTLRKNPAERYATVTALADDLQRFLAKEPISARPDSVGYRARKFVQRHRGGVVMAAVLTLAVAGGVAGTLTQAHRAEQQAQRANLERDHAIQELTSAEAISEFLSYLLSTTSDKPMTTLELLGRAEQQIARQFASDPALRAGLLLELANLYTETDQLDREVAVLKQARAAARLTTDIQLQAGIDCLLTSENADPGAPVKAMFDNAVARLRPGKERDPAPLAECLNIRGEYLFERGELEAALADHQEALALLPSPRAGQRRLVISIRQAMAGPRAQLGELTAAIANMRSAIADTDALGRGDTQAAATLHNNLGFLLGLAGNPQLALQEFDTAIAIIGGHEGGGDVTPAIQFNRATQMVEMGRLKEGMTLVLRAMASARGRGDARTLSNAQGLIGSIHCATGNLAQCKRMLDLARAGLLKLYPGPHSQHALIELHTARWALASKDAALAAQRAQQALEMYAKLKQHNPPHAVRARSLLALAQWQLGQKSEALATAEQAVTQGRVAANGQAHSVWLGGALLTLGELQTQQGLNQAAGASLKEAAEQLRATLGEASPASRKADALLVQLSGKVS
jgi:serine/threonine-protein kinase